MNVDTGKDAQNAEDLASAVAQALMQGKKRDDIVKVLVKNGMSRDIAFEFVTDVLIRVEAFKLTPEGRGVMARKYRTRMIHGALWCLGGILVTSLTASAAGEGGYFLFAWGAILFGGIGAIVGFVGWAKWR